MTAEAATAERAVSSRPKRPLRPRLIRIGLTLAVVVPVLWSALGLEISMEQLRSAPGDMWTIIRLSFPPDLSSESIERALPKIMESVWIAWIGTIIGAFFSFFLAFAAATNIAPRRFATGVRQVLNAIRAVPELLVAMILIPVTGLGALTGTLALGIHSIGTLGKLSSEVIEGIDEGPVEAVASVGGTKLQQMRFGVVPQVMPNIVAYWLYRFEINIRASAVLGVVGAGGIGAEIFAQLKFRNFPRVAIVLLLTIAVVLIVDTISARVRRRIISGHRERGPIEAYSAMRWWQRILTIVATVAGVAITIFILFQYQQAIILG